MGARGVHGPCGAIGRNWSNAMTGGAPSPDFIGDLYAAAVEETLSPAFTTLLERATGIATVSLWVTENGDYVDMNIAGAYASLVPSYRERFGKIDPWAASLARNPLESVMLGSEHLPEKELLRSEFYNDWARHGGMLRPIGVRMRLAPGVYATMGSDNPFARRLFEPADKGRIRSVLPHVKRALQLRRRFRQANQWGARRAAALDAFAFGVIICDQRTCVVAANAEAEALARSNSGIVLTAGGRAIGALHAAEQIALRRLVRDAAGGGAGGILRITSRDGVPALLALVAPMPRALHHLDGRGHAVIALRSLAAAPGFGAVRLASFFGLSPTQAEIALALFQGRSLDEIAVERGVKITTIRTQLARLFARTGAESQRDLVRLIGLLPPLRSP
jgi:DNA-binding CsgD family transcriptional regulator